MDRDRRKILQRGSLAFLGLTGLATAEARETANGESKAEGGTLVTRGTQMSTQRTNRRNVLLIANDDMRPVLGCYGDPLAVTPNIDRLARSGVVFTNAACQSPLCGPSRVSFMSGRRPESTGAIGWKPPGPDLMYAPKWFRQHDYITSGFGKVFHHARAYTRYEIQQFQREDRPPALHFPYDGDAEAAARLYDLPLWNPPDCWNRYDFCNTPDDPCGYGYAYSSALIEGGDDCCPLQEKHVIARGSLRPKPRCSLELVNGSYWHEWASLNLKDDETSDGLAARRAVDAIEDACRNRQPFFAAVGFRRPHEILCAPKPYFDLHANTKAGITPEPREHIEGLSQLALNYPKHMAYEIFSDAERIAWWRAYHACISFVDAQVGVLLDALDRLDLWGSTVIVFLADNGLHHGEHGGQSNKMTCFEESARVPLIVSAPGFASAGVVCGKPVELIDVFPTLTDLCGQPSPEELDGASLRPLLEDPDAAEWSKPAHSIVLRRLAVRADGTKVALNECETGGPLDFEGPPREVYGRTVRTERFRYTEWDDAHFGAELYDEGDDPHEFLNRADDPAYRSIREEVRNMLHRVAIQT